jgi:DNA mismatch endonuclease (patch repair protein)
MADIVDRPTRSWMMSGIRSKNTKPELAVRRFLHANGFRYRLHVPNLPGRPDIVLPRHRSIVEVRGCFWHQHRGCRFAYTPKSNVGFWRRKLRETVSRDARTAVDLSRLGWRVFTIWECEIGNPERMKALAATILTHPTPAEISRIPSATSHPTAAR